MSESKPNGLRCERYTLDQGELCVFFPCEMSADDVEEVEAHLTALIKRMKRRASKGPVKESDDV